jgi:hypothetical protein
MDVLNSCYLIDPQPLGHNFIISKSFKKELIRCLSIELKRQFGKNINLNKIYIQFCGKTGWGEGETKEELLLKPVPSVNNISYANNFKVGFSPHYGHTALLMVGNLKWDFPILDPTEEVEPNSLVMTLEFGKGDLESLRELFKRDFKSRDLVLYQGCSFPIKFNSLGTDCEIKVRFEEKQDKDSKAKVISIVAEAIEAFNAANESEENSKGLIHNVVNIKSEKTNSNNLTFVVDLGSAGEEGLKVFFTAFENTQIPIEIVEVK